MINERVGLARWLAIFGGISGCALVMDLNGQNIQFNAADLLGLFSGVFWALGSVTVRRFNKINFLHVTFLQYLFGGIMAVGAVFYVGDSTGNSNTCIWEIQSSNVDSSSITSSFLEISNRFIVDTSSSDYTGAYDVSQIIQNA